MTQKDLDKLSPEEFWDYIHKLIDNSPEDESI